jgi:hypothetical protein
MLVQARANNYIRGERVNPAFRIINGKSTPGSESTEKNNDILEFHSVKRVSGSKPVQDVPKYRKAQW